MGDIKNAIFAAIVLSAIVLIGWEYFYALPQKQRQEELQRQAQITQVQPAPPAGSTAGEQKSREAIITSTARVPIETPRIKGSIALKGGRIDDVSLAQYHETVDPSSPAIVLLSPSGSLNPFYAEFGWSAPAGTTAKIPGPETLWSRVGTGSLGPGRPVTLSYDNGEGLTFRRTISVDDKYLFTLKDEVANSGLTSVSLYPYALVSRQGTLLISGYYIRHEGLIGVMGDQGVQQFTYKAMEDKRLQQFNVTNAWMGITDKYWAAALLPDTTARVLAEFRADTVGAIKTYQTGYLLDQQVISPGTTGSTNARLFVGLKEAAVVGIGYPLPGIAGYNALLNLNRFDLLIDWGWFSFITKPMFLVLDVLYIGTGNFGVAILIVAVLIKLIFFPFANSSYRSLIKMRRLQPQIAVLRDRFREQEQANKEIADLYKRENVTAPSGCLPIIAQMLVTFSLYKILFVTIEPRASSFGWIQDLTAPDQTNVFNLFDLLPFDPTKVPLVGHFLHLGALPILLGLTLWQLQQKISPTLLGSFQRKIYVVLPILVIYFASDMMAGMVIYFTWFNCLSLLHQLLLMNKEKDVVGDINETAAEVLPYGKIQSIVLLTLLAPILQNVLTGFVFWRRSKTGSGHDRT